MNEVDWPSVPIFGAGPNAHAATVRPSAYGLIVDESGRVAVVRTPEGVFLPGGGIEPGETPREAVIREAREECGFVVRIGSFRARAVQFTREVPAGIHYAKRSTFLSATVDSMSEAGGEADHALIWVAKDRAPQALADESHRWAINAWIANDDRFGQNAG